jgi:hypothetical protein
MGRFAGFRRENQSTRGQLLGELLPIVAEISAVLDPEQLMPAIAGQLRRIVDYRILDIFLPEPDGTLGARVRGGLRQGDRGPPAHPARPGHRRAPPPSRRSRSSSPT